MPLRSSTTKAFCGIVRRSNIWVSCRLLVTHRSSKADLCTRSPATAGTSIQAQQWAWLFRLYASRLQANTWKVIRYQRYGRTYHGCCKRLSLLFTRSCLQFRQLSSSDIIRQKNQASCNIHVCMRLVGSRTTLPFAVSVPFHCTALRCAVRYSPT